MEKLALAPLSLVSAFGVLGTGESFAQTRLVVERSFTQSCDRCNLENSNFNGWDLEKCSFAQSLLDFSYLNSVQAQDADFTSVSARNADFSTANLSRANFNNADLRQTKFTKVTATMANFENTLFVGAILDGSSFMGSVFERTTLPNVSARETEFTSALLKRVDLSGADLEGSDFINTIIVETNFSRAKLKGVDFTDAILVDVNFKGASDIHPDSFSGACKTADTVFESALIKLPICDAALLTTLKLK